MCPQALHFEPLILRETPSDKATPSGLLILVHGRTGNLRVLEFMAKRQALRAFTRLLVQAPYTETRPEQKDEGFSWYRDKRSGLEESRKRLDLLVDAALEAGWAPRDIYWLGFSQGSAMILDLALRQHSLFGGFVCVSGFCLSRPEDVPTFSPQASSQRILITHGSRDQILTLDYAQTSYEILRLSGIPFQWKVFDKPHSFKLKEEIPFIESQLLEWAAHRSGVISEAIT